jgi:ribosomal protein S18 acetylase RimI-like enzyme
MTMEIRQLQEYEIPAAAELVQGVFGFDLQRTIRDEKLIEGFYDYANEGSMTNRIRCGQLILWGAFEGPDLCGVSGMQPEGHITMLYVYPRFRRMGCGRELLQAMRAFAKNSLGLDRVTVSAMPAWTANYFTRNGFTVLASQANPEFVNLEAGAMKESVYPVKKIRGGTLAAVIVTTVVLILAVSIGFLCVYTAGM